MIWLIFSFVFVALAAACNAVMDKSSHHYSSSIFSDFGNELWWNGEISWRNKYNNGDSTQGRVKWYFGLNKPVQITDAWHFFKMWMIIFMCSSVTCGIFSHQENIIWWWFVIYLGSLGTLWNITFSAFYDKILKKNRKNLTNIKTYNIFAYI